jgi:hypothetical protein
MLEQDAGRKAHRTGAAFSEIETGLSQINDPKQGARLVRAFLRITDPTLRLAIVQMVENVGSAPPDGDQRKAGILGISLGHRR